MMNEHLDLTDPMVREMADRNHMPDEVWTIGGAVMVMCRCCGQGWPCKTRRDLSKLSPQ